MMSINTVFFVVGVSHVISQRWISNDTYFESTPDLRVIPNANNSIGQISLHESLEMQFDLIYYGKSALNEYENVFRIGYSGSSLCTEAGTRFPAMWIHPTDNQFQITISESNTTTSCWDGSSPWIDIDTNVQYHFVIRFNQTWKYASISDDTTTNVFINEERLPTSDVVLYTFMDIWFSTANIVAANVELWNIIINTKDELTLTPTAIPSSMPTTYMPTQRPSQRPTYRPIIWSSDSDSKKKSKEKTKWSSSDSSDSQKKNKWKHYSKYKRKRKRNKANKAYLQNEMLEDIVDDENVYIYQQKHESTPIGVAALFIAGFAALFIIMIVSICLVCGNGKRKKKHTEVNNNDYETDDNMRELDGIVNERTGMTAERYCK